MKEIFISSGELTVGLVTLEKHPVLKNNVRVICENKNISLIDFSISRLKFSHSNGITNSYKLIKR